MKKETQKQKLIRYALILGIAVIIIKFGIIPTLNGSYIKSNFKENITGISIVEGDIKKYDVIVIGEEPEGIISAVAAARKGAKTLLISEREDLGGNIEQTFYPTFESTVTEKGELLNQGILNEIYIQLSESFSIDKYKKLMNGLVYDTKNLDVLLGGKLGNIKINATQVAGIDIVKDNKVCYFEGKRFIDATKEGKLLKDLSIRCYTGAEDLNKPENYSPIKLNFLVQGIDYGEISRIYQNSKLNSSLINFIKNYQPENKDLIFRNIIFFEQDKGNIIINGVEIKNFNVFDENSYQKNYNSAVEEAKKFSIYLRKTFKNCEFVRPAKKLLINESIHYIGQKVLTVNDILGNKDFENKIAIGNAPISGNRLAKDTNNLIIGKPDKYSIPLECIVPKGIDNVLMVGDKISYSSLASTSAGKRGVSIEIGQSAGILAAMSIDSNLLISDVINNKEVKFLEKFNKELIKEDVILKNMTFEEPKEASNTQTEFNKNYVYPAVKQLRTLGLLVGGYKNNYKYSDIAQQKDLVGILINGTDRLGKTTISNQLSEKLQSYNSINPISKVKLIEILGIIYNVKLNDSGDKFEQLINSANLDKSLLTLLNEDENMKYNQLYYLGATLLKNITKSDILDFTM